MTLLGRFLELSVPAPMIRTSLDFYWRLGFTELPVNEIRTGYYAAVTDGRVVIGLHGSGLEEPALSFVRPNLARHLAAMVARGAELVFQRLGDDEFNEVGLRSPDGHLILLLEARTFSTAALAELPPPVIGRSQALGLRTANPAASLPFWLGTGLEADGQDSQAVTVLGVRLALRTELPWQGPVLLFGACSPEAAGLLGGRDLHPQRFGTDLVLQAPEGTRLLLSPQPAPGCMNPARQRGIP